MSKKLCGKYFAGECTPEKQRRYAHLVKFELMVLDKIFKKHLLTSKKKVKAPWISETAIFVDLNAGPGLNPKDGAIGSPLILLDALHRYKYPCKVYLCDNDPCMIEKLTAVCRQRYYMQLARTSRSGTNHGYWFPRRPGLQVIILNGDNCTLLEKIITANWINRIGEKDIWRYGYVYSDPTGRVPPFETLNTLYRKFYSWPFDIIINCPTTTMLRCKIRLDELILPMKEFWHLTEPIGKHRFSMLYGNNSDKIVPGKPFISHMSPAGQNLLYRLSYTKEERGGNSSSGNPQQRDLWE